MKVALVTGGNKGIGYELCRNPAQAGHFVAINMRIVQLAWELLVTNTKVNSANPGFTKTDLNKNQGTQSVEVGALAATKLALVGESGPTGSAVSKAGMDPW